MISRYKLAKRPRLTARERDTLREARRAIGALERTIERLRVIPTAGGERWRTGQIRYFEERQAEVVSSLPDKLKRILLS